MENGKCRFVGQISIEDGKSALIGEPVKFTPNPSEYVSGLSKEVKSDDMAECILDLLKLGEKEESPYIFLVDPSTFISFRCANPVFPTNLKKMVDSYFSTLNALTNREKIAPCEHVILIHELFDEDEIPATKDVMQRRFEVLISKLAISLGPTLSFFRVVYAFQVGIDLKIDAYLVKAIGRA